MEFARDVVALCPEISMSVDGAEKGLDVRLFPGVGTGRMLGEVEPVEFWGFGVDGEEEGEFVECGGTGC